MVSMWVGRFLKENKLYMWSAEANLRIPKYMNYTDADNDGLQDRVDQGVSDIHYHRCGCLVCS